jgi:hypothetical protein
MEQIWSGYEARADVDEIKTVSGIEVCGGKWF